MDHVIILRDTDLATIIRVTIALVLAPLYLGV